jgi:plastocyanin
MPHRFVPFVLLSVLALPRLLFGGAAVEGSIALSKQRAAPVQSKRYEIVSTGDILSTNPPIAVIYLEGEFSRPASLPMQQMSQKDMAFQPTLLAIPTGTTVEFPNLDDTYHNIFSYSPTKRFDLGRYRPDERPIPTVTFDKPGLVVLRCDIHEHMRGLILVIDTPYFVQTDTAGHYRLDGLPAGHFILKVWLDSKTTLERPVDLRDGEVVHADFP